MGKPCCRICDKVVSYNNIKQHILYAHFDDFPFPCPKCDASFAGKAPFVAHFTLKHPLAGDCPSFILSTNAEALLSHLRTKAFPKTNGHVKLICDHCDKCIGLNNRIRHANVCKRTK